MAEEKGLDGRFLSLDIVATAWANGLKPVERGCASEWTGAWQVTELSVMDWLLLY